MFEVVGLNLQEAEDRHDLADGAAGVHLDHVEEPWNVLLQVQVDFDVLETWATAFPDVLHPVSCDFLELVNFAEELVQLVDRLVKQHVLRFF